jgi:hypothetical protein
MDERNRNRLEEFRQLRQEIRHSEEYLIVGIDIAKDRHHAFFGTATGRHLEAACFRRRGGGGKLGAGGGPAGAQG